MKKKSLEKYNDSLQSVFVLVEKLTMLQRLIISGSVVVLLVAGFGFLSYKPKFDQLDKINTQYEKVKKDLDIAMKKAAQLEALKEEWAEKQEQFAAAMNALPDKKEIPSLLDEISRAGNEAGLEFQTFSPLGEASHQFYAEIPVQLEIRGEYQDIFSFFEKVANMSRIVNIKDIDMKLGTTGGKEEGNSLMVATNCKAVTYRFLSTEESKPKNKKKR